MQAAPGRHKREIDSARSSSAMHAQKARDINRYLKIARLVTVYNHRAFALIARDAGCVAIGARIGAFADDREVRYHAAVAEAARGAAADPLVEEMVA